MLISLDWIRDFSPLDKQLTPEELGLRLTMGTAEVEGVETVNEFWKKIRVVEITHIEPHPEADKLNLVTFKVSDDQTFRVVCGASNVRVGLKTPFAPIGTTLPVGFTLEPKKIRGILSEGMLCSEEELGLADSSAGIMELPEDSPVGESLDILWDKKIDTLFDIDNKSLTHRPDLWGHYGMAREFSALYKTPFESPFSKEWEDNLEKNFTSDKAPMGVSVSDDSCGLAYWGLSLDGVKVEESPNWIKDRLTAVGLRPINNIVDISNYVMLELGMPLHIFDRNKISGDMVYIESLKEECTFITLDEVERRLVPGDTVIMDNKEPLVIGGIMGGLNSGVTDETTSVFIEVANWKAARVRGTSTRLGLRTDSSMRYEKTLDSTLCYRTLLRTVELILKLCPEAKVVGKPQYDGVDLSQTKELSISITPMEITKTLGKDLEVSEIVDILERLDFKVKKGDEILQVDVPSYRATKDVECAADIIEEVGRVVGYDNIEPQSPKLDIRPVGLSPLHMMKRKAQDYLSLYGNAFEVNSYPMIGEDLLKKVQWPSRCEELKLINSLSVEQDRMRDSMVPSFVEISAKNAKNYETFRFFEFGRTYQTDEKTFAKENHVLTIGFYNKAQSPVIDLLDCVEGLCHFLNIPMDYVDRHPKFKSSVVPEEWVGLHPFEFKNCRIMGKMNGAVFSIHPTILKGFKVKGNLSLAVIDLSAFEKNAPKSKVNYKPLPKFPTSRFDYTMSLNTDQSIEDIFGVLSKTKLPVKAEHRVVTIYEPEKGQRHVTMTALLSKDDSTLTGDEIKACEEKILSGMEKAGIKLKEG